MLHTLTLAIVAPDIICSDITTGKSYGVIGDYQSYSFSDSACNIGDAPFTYNANTPDHPVKTSWLCRIQDGRFEQIGMRAAAERA